LDSIGGGKWNAIICVAGGWAGGNAADPGFLKSAQLMWRQTVESSTIAAYLGAHYLTSNGFLALTGAKAALQGTGGMIGYGMAKAAVHQLTKSLASLESSGLPSGSRVLCVLPVTLDTPANRSAMPKADFTSWTPLNDLAE
jgi:dihydropteridine reductase